MRVGWLFWCWSWLKMAQISCKLTWRMFDYLNQKIVWLKSADTSEASATVPSYIVVHSCYSTFTLKCQGWSCFWGKKVTILTLKSLSDRPRLTRPRPRAQPGTRTSYVLILFWLFSSYLSNYWDNIAYQGYYFGWDYHTIKFCYQRVPSCAS